MNDEQLTKRLADLFRVEGEGSEELQTRLRSLQQNHKGVTPRRRQMILLRIAGGLAATLALATGLLVYPRATRPVSAATSVRQALAKVTTWHLKGWKTQDGRRVDWEIWGRRTPFFYREQVGKDIVLDDGRQRLSIYGPSQERNQLTGICIRHPSLQDGENVPWSYHMMVETWSHAGKPWMQAAQGPVYNFSDSGMEGYGINTDCLYYVDKDTSLPTRYEQRHYHAGHEDARQTTALLNAEYNVSLPQSVSAAHPPAGYQFYDAMKTPAGLENADTKNGLTIQCEPLAMDHKGNILVRLNGWLGCNPFQYGKPGINFEASARRWRSDWSINPPVNYDDKGRAYVGIRADILKGSSLLMLFVPLEPLDNDAPLPGRLTATLHADVSIGGGQNVLHEELTVSARLPDAGEPIGEAVDRYNPVGVRTRIISFSGKETLQTCIDEARAEHYGAVQTREAAHSPEFQRHLYWAERAIEEDTSGYVQMKRLRLAWDYWDVLRDETNARRLVQDVLQERRFLKSLEMPPDSTPQAAARMEHDTLWQYNYYRSLAKQILATIEKAKRKEQNRP
jgi:hypothetical protein